MCQLLPNNKSNSEFDGCEDDSVSNSCENISSEQSSFITASLDWVILCTSFSFIAIFKESITSERVTEKRLLFPVSIMLSRGIQQSNLDG